MTHSQACGSWTAWARTIFVLSGGGCGGEGGPDETLSLFDPNTFPLKPGLHVVQIHCHLIQPSRLHAAPLPLQGKDENIQLLAGEVGVRACDNQAGCLDLIRPPAGCPSISLAPSIPVPVFPKARR